MAKKALKATDRQSRIINKKHMGDEPKRIRSTPDLIRAYTWYHVMYSYDDARRWFLDYVKSHHPSVIKSAQELTNVTMNRTMGWIARLVMIGCEIPEGVKEKLEVYIETLPKPSGIREEEAAGRVVPSLPPKDRIGEFLPDFEDALDSLDSTFSAYHYLTSREVPQVYVRRIMEYYTPILDEVEAARTKSDKQCVEAYSIWSRKDLTSLANYINTFITDCNKVLGNAKKARKPRRKKVRSATDILKHFQYMEKHDELKLVSENPEKLIGAKYLLALNTSGNILTIYTAKDGGLSVHRSSVSNFDEAKSSSKRVGRKVREVIEIANSGTSRRALKALDGINSTLLPVNGRINKNTILLRIIK